MAKFEKHTCSNCDAYTNWVIKDGGVKCTGCGTSLSAPGPFGWSKHTCSHCDAYTNWIEASNGLVVCTGCGRGA